MTVYYVAGSTSPTVGSALNCFPKVAVKQHFTTLGNV